MLDSKALEAACLASEWAAANGGHCMKAAITAFLAASQEPAPATGTRLDQLEAIIHELAGDVTPGGPEDRAWAIINEMRTAPVPPVVGEDAVERAACAIGKVFYGAEGELNDLTASQWTTLRAAAELALASSVAKPFGVRADIEAQAWNCDQWPSWLHDIVSKTNEVADRLDMSAEQAHGYAALSCLSHPAQGWREDAVERAVRAWAYEEYYLAGGGVGSWHEKLSFNKPKDGRLDIRSIAPLYVAPPEGGVAQDLLAAIKQLMPSNLGSLPATMPDSATLPLDVTFGELRQAIAAIAKAEGRSDA